jgi:protein-S-isoprenylcysteine O-methyltransferase Ste14
MGFNLSNSAMLSVNGILWGIWLAVWIVLAKSVNKTKRSESASSRWMHLAPTGFAFFTVFTPQFLPARFFSENLEVTELGNLITAIGLAFAIWARVHLGRYWSGVVTLKEGHRLIRTGPYRFARHPIYTGMFAGFIGSVMVSGKISSLVAVLILIAAYARKVKLEEKILLNQFSEEYAQYKREVKAIIPFIL